MRVLDWLHDAPRAVRWVGVLAWMGLIFFLSAQPDLPHPSLGWLDLVISCGAHAFLYAVLALLLGWALALGRRPLPLALVLAVLYGFSDEFHQAFVPGRHPDPLDIVCNTAGAATALGAWAWLSRVCPRARRADSS